MFRYVLAGSERRLVPLGEELAFVDSYLEIERARFGRRLRVAREVAPEAAELPMPSLILQPLVENAVQHGQGTDGSIDICIHIAVQDKTVLISVADQGPGMPPNHSIGNSPGHGLRNVNERLQKIYGVGLEVGNNEPCGTIVTVRIPREQST
jgi:two-component system LytT family sensor kinase